MNKAQQLLALVERSPWKSASHVNASGSSFTGVEVRATYKQLVGILGEPHATDLDKTKAEWIFKHIFGNWVTIYDYKEPDTGFYTKPINWHIGARGGDV